MKNKLLLVISALCLQFSNLSYSESWGDDSPNRAGSSARQQANAQLGIDDQLPSYSQVSNASGQSNQQHISEQPPSYDESNLQQAIDVSTQEAADIRSMQRQVARRRDLIVPQSLSSDSEIQQDVLENRHSSVSVDGQPAAYVLEHEGKHLVIPLHLPILRIQGMEFNYSDRPLGPVASSLQGREHEKILRTFVAEYYQPRRAKSPHLSALNTAQTRSIIRSSSLLLEYKIHHEKYPIGSRTTCCGREKKIWEPRIETIKIIAEMSNGLMVKVKPIIRTIVSLDEDLPWNGQ